MESSLIVFQTELNDWEEVEGNGERAHIYATDLKKTSLFWLKLNLHFSTGLP